MRKKAVFVLLIATLLSIGITGCGAVEYDVDPLRLYDNGYVNQNKPNLEKEGWVQSDDERLDILEKNIQTIIPGYKTTARCLMDGGDVCLLVSYLLTSDNGKFENLQIEGINKIFEKLIESYGEPTTIEAVLDDGSGGELSVSEFKKLDWEKIYHLNNLNEVKVSWRNETDEIDFLLMAFKEEFTIVIKYYK